jgi:nucleotide-binding universal stress UspA family protein
MLRNALARVPIRRAEKERLDREQFEATGFVSNLERLLLTVDESPNGKLAATLAGLIAGLRRLPMTVLSLEAKSAPAKAVDAGGESASGEALARAAAQAAQKSDKEQMPSPSIDITVRSPEEPIEAVVASEAKKGYDLLVVGIDRTRARSGGFHRDIGRVVSAFGGPVAVVAARNPALPCPSSILVPISGNNVSWRAAELAIALARACNCPITALYVTFTAGGTRRRAHGIRPAEQAQAVLDEIMKMAARYRVKIETAIHEKAAPDQAILAQLKEAGHDLLVMGVSRRPGKQLFFGETAAAVFRDSPGSLIFLTT